MTNEKTLLQKALAHKTPLEKMTQEDYDLVVAHIREEITLTGLMKVKGIKNSASAYLYVVKVIKYFADRFAIKK